MATAASELRTRPGEATSRTALLFTLCFVLAQADKQVMGLLAAPVQATFRLSDTQLGFLQGGAFAIAFAIGGLPIARLLDRGNRVRIASACVAAWSCATLLCGVAASFASLLVFRAATAVAEAGLPPAALSIFSQSRDRHLTARLTSLFMLAPFVGGGLVLVLGGLLIEAIANRDLELPGGAEPWRFVFLAVAVPGFLLAPLLALLGSEPARPSRERPRTQAHSYLNVLRAIFIESRFLRHYYLGLTCFYLFVAALIGWYPTFLVRELGLSIAAAGSYAGLIYLIAGIAGSLSATTLVSLRKQVTVGGLARDGALAVALLVPVSLLLPLVGSVGWSLALYAINAFISAGLVALMAVPIQLSLDNSVQARGLAVFSLLMSALAGSLGPLAVGLLSDQASLSLGAALAVTGVCAMGMSCLLLSIAAYEARSEVEGGEP
jgi:MFS family permease